METSGNVLVEDLQNTRSLETTYYITDATQAYDSFWDRDSGLRVHIGVMNVHLIPEYEDVDHQGDNNYMLTDPNSSEDKSLYRAVTHNFCRSDIRVYMCICWLILSAEMMISTQLSVTHCALLLTTSIALTAQVLTTLPA